MQVILPAAALVREIRMKKTAAMFFLILLTVSTYGSVCAGDTETLSGILFGLSDATMLDTIDSRTPIAYTSASGRGLYGILD